MKSTLPLSLHKAIAPILTKIKDEALIIDRNSKILKIDDAEKGSDFYFEIINIESRDDNVLIVTNQKPATQHNVGILARTEWVENLTRIFDEWMELVKEYQAVPTVFDDPFIEKYEKEFFAEFEILDDDADTVGFDYHKQILIDKGLAAIVQVLEKERDENNSEKIDDLISEADEIKGTLTELTKKETVSRISKLFAKIRKGGMKLMKDTYPILQKEIIGQAVKGLMELASDAHIHIHTIAESVKSAS